MADEQEQAVMQRFYSSLWKACEKQKKTHSETIAAALMELADGMDKALTPGMYRVHSAALSDLSKDELILAFSRATLESKGFFPVPATLREFSGRAATGDPIAAEAKTELLKLIEGMRGPHGRTLKPLPGRVLYGSEDDPKDEAGDRVAVPIRADSSVFPIARRTEAALVRLGWGDRAAGIALIADHPAVASRINTMPDDDQFRKNQLRASDEILKRWAEAYREV